MGKYGLAKCPVFKEDGDVYETAPFGERRGTYTHKGVDIVRHVGCNTTATVTAIADGTVDAIVTDHAPHHIDDKDVEFDLAANGISGLETSLSLGYMYLVQTGAVELTHWVELMSVSPARILGVDMGVLKEGGRADVTVFDPQKQWTVRAEELQTKGKNTPFLGRTLTGKACDVIVDGRHVVKDYKVVD